ncbi:MAG: 16S rRNA (guanine(527)-N(7))-methyltransferase RsmG [Syntrophobacteraceae bacterium]
MDKQEFITTLLGLTQNEGICFSREQAELCCVHIELMLEWNSRHNLTRITDLYEILVNHLLDSLIPARWLPHAGFALDVGTGAGFPGIPLKILLPELSMVLLEAHRKKTSFLSVALLHLKLGNTWVLQERWEELTRISGPLAGQRYDLVTMRAVRLDSAQLAYFGAEILGEGGTFAWWAGPGADPVTKSLTARKEGDELIFEGERTYILPAMRAPRRIFIWKKIGR